MIKELLPSVFESTWIHMKFHTSHSRARVNFVRLLGPDHNYVIDVAPTAVL
jgi:hypothetical protein